jgi:hypothetical protein
VPVEQEASSTLLGLGRRLKFCYSPDSLVY